MYTADMTEHSSRTWRNWIRVTLLLLPVGIAGCQLLLFDLPRWVDWTVFVVSFGTTVCVTYYAVFQPKDRVVASVFIYGQRTSHLVLVMLTILAAIPFVAGILQGILSIRHESNLSLISNFVTNIIGVVLVASMLRYIRTTWLRRQYETIDFRGYGIEAMSGLLALIPVGVYGYFSLSRDGVEYALQLNFIYLLIVYICTSLLTVTILGGVKSLKKPTVSRLPHRVFNWAIIYSIVYAVSLELQGTVAVYRELPVACMVSFAVVVAIYATVFSLSMCATSPRSSFYVRVQAAIATGILALHAWRVGTLEYGVGSLYQATVWIWLVAVAVLLAFIYLVYDPKPGVKVGPKEHSRP